METEIANVLAKNLRAGKYSGHKFSKVIGAGHSFGSVITEGITAKYPMTLGMYSTHRTMSNIPLTCCVQTALS